MKIEVGNKETSISFTKVGNISLVYFKTIDIFLGKLELTRGNAASMNKMITN